MKFTLNTIAAILLCSCGSTSNVQSVTKNSDGTTTTTTTPVMSPEDAAFHAQCEKVLERRFE